MNLVDGYINFERKKIYRILYYISMLIYYPLLLCSISYLQPQLGEGGMRILHHTRILAYLMLLMIVGDSMLKDFLLWIKNHQGIKHNQRIENNEGIENNQGIKPKQGIKHNQGIEIVQEIKNKSFLSREQWILAAALLISVIVAYVSRKSEAFVIMLIIAATIDVRLDTRKLFALIAAIQFGSIILFWYMNVKGILPDSQYYNGARIRHSFGFAYVTFAPMLLLFVSMEYIYFRGVVKISLLELGLLVFGNVFLYRYCKSRNSMLIFTAVLAAALAYKCKPNFMDKIMGIFSKFIGGLMALIAAVSFIGPFIFDRFHSGDVSRELSSLASRFRLSYEAMHKYKVFTLFGQKIEWEAPLLSSNKDGYIFVDNAYLHGLLDFGIIYFAIMILIYLLILKILKDRKEYMNYFMVVMVLCLSVLDPRLWVLVFNPFPLLIAEGYQEIIYKKMEN